MASASSQKLYRSHPATTGIDCIELLRAIPEVGLGAHMLEKRQPAVFVKEVPKHERRIAEKLLQKSDLAT